MYRTLAAAAFAAVLLPAGAFAAPGPVTTFGKSYTLACSVNANDGEALKVRTMVKNTTGHIIKKGTPIALRFTYSYTPGVRPNGPTTMTQIAWRDVLPNTSIGFDQPRGALRCSATVTLRPDVSSAIIKRTR
jgi:hypothetical protein